MILSIREDAHTLTRSQLLAVVLDLGEGAATGKQHFAISVFDGFLKCAFRLGRRVGEGENDGMLIKRGHLLDELGRKSTTDGGKTHQDRWLHKFNKTAETLNLLPIVVIASKVDLVLGEFITTIQCHETLYSSVDFLGRAESGACLHLSQQTRTSCELHLQCNPP